MMAGMLQSVLRAPKEKKKVSTSEAIKSLFLLVMKNVCTSPVFVEAGSGIQNVSKFWMTRLDTPKIPVRFRLMQDMSDLL